MINLLVKPLLDVAGTAVKGFVETKKAKAELAVTEVKAKQKLKEDMIAGRVQWEQEAVSQMETSWKDEFWTLVLAVPLFCLGYSVIVDDPDILQRVSDSFSALDNLPDWYQYLLFLAVSASFGIRGADKLMKLKGSK